MSTSYSIYLCFLLLMWMRGKIYSEVEGKVGKAGDKNKGPWLMEEVWVLSSKDWGAIKRINEEGK